MVHTTQKAAFIITVIRDKGACAIVAGLGRTAALIRER